MAGWYWVSYLIHDRANGTLTGHGTIELEMDLPACADDVFKLAERVTEESHRRGTIAARDCVLVQTWSPMGGQR